MQQATQVQPQQAQDPKFDVRVTSNMYLMLVGKLVSLFGSNIYNFAISLYVLKATGSGLSFATTLIFGILPRIILGPFAGAIADHFDRKKMVVGMDFVSGLVVLGLWGISLSNGLQLHYIYITAMLLAICNTFFGVALDASIPNLVDEKRLTKINSLNQGISSLTQILAPMFGGVIYGFVNIQVFLIINGISFIASAISELFINFELTSVKDESDNHETEKISFNKIFNDMREGFHYLRKKEILFILLNYSLFLNFFFNLGLVVPLPYIINTVIGLTPSQFGIIQGALPVGIFLGSILLSILPEFKHKYKILTNGLFIMTLLLICIGLPALPQFTMLGKQFAFIFYIVIGFGFGFVNIFINVPIMVMMQKEADNKYRGRVFGLIQTIAMGITPLSFLIAGLLIETLPAYLLPFGAGIFLLILFFVMLTNRTLKKI